MSDTDRLRELCDDWEVYGQKLAGDEAWQHDMQRAVLVEMEHELENLKKLARMTGPAVRGRGPRRD